VAVFRYRLPDPPGRLVLVPDGQWSPGTVAEVTRPVLAAAARLGLEWD
jgi:hypothetical protein